MSKPGQNTIALNKRARFDYHIEERLEAGVALEGWEVKSLREGRVEFSDSYVFIRNGEAFLVGTQINPLPTVSTHITPEPMRSRKLLLHRRDQLHHQRNHQRRFRRRRRLWLPQTLV